MKVQRPIILQSLKGSMKGTWDDAGCGFWPRRFVDNEALASGILLPSSGLADGGL